MKIPFLCLEMKEFGRNLFISRLRKLLVSIYLITRF